MHNYTVKTKLSDQIRKSISYRILFCFLLTLILIIIVSFFDIFSGIDELKKNLDARCKSLSEFTISQLLINSPDAVKMQLDSINKENKDLTYKWINNVKINSASFDWSFPINWRYNFPIINSEGSNFGSFVITGTFFSDNALVKDIATKIGLLTVFLIMILLVLWPLSEKIPRKLFIDPVDELLKLLKNDNDQKNNSIIEFPEEINEIRNKIVFLLKEAEVKSLDEALWKIARQVAHDIRSPLDSLLSAVKLAQITPNQKKIEIRNITNRVKDLASHIMEKYKNDTNSHETETTKELVSTLIQSIVSEIRLQVQNKMITINYTIEKEARDIFININSNEFKRVISNIVNNSIEALGGEGYVEVILSRINDQAVISIKDNGKGIPDEKLPFVFDEGVSFGKSGGAGLGLSYVANSINAWNGDYTLKSKVNEGTIFEILLTECKPASWYTNSVNLSKDTEILILDDETYIHDLWDDILSDVLIKNESVKIFHFVEAVEFIKYVKNKKNNNRIYLLDYELSDNHYNGIKVAEELEISDCSYLITSLHDDKDIRDKCSKTGMKIIPKSFEQDIEIRLVPEYDLVFVDDDETICEIWRERAELANLKIIIFSTAQEFIRVCKLLKKSITIYIDSCLNDHNAGEDIAKNLYQCGYTNIFMSTAFPKEKFIEMYWLKGVISKEPPF